MSVRLTSNNHCFQFRSQEGFQTWADAFWVSNYPAQLSTLECIYIRGDLMTESFQTIGFEKDANSAPNIAHNTLILGMVPVPRRLYNQWHKPAVDYPNGQGDPSPPDVYDYDYFQEELITWEDTNNQYLNMLGAHRVGQMRITLTDDKGRLIQPVGFTTSFMDPATTLSVPPTIINIKPPYPLGQTLDGNLSHTATTAPDGEPVWNCRSDEN